ncbi:MICOS complex subunit MIC60 [Novosphingobium kaempferiae]|uniref:MICOS complex subunit MIC60 n=1 Tax=Novosphingobium kaempferiae TaxID=2896849 RepID=UPI001E33AF53|nr:MICOS complex subunit MIC60 [Novosphingobium kaempferiae]
MQDIPPPAPPAAPETIYRGRSAGMTLFVAFIAFVIGVGLVAWMAERGYLHTLIESGGAAPQAAAPMPRAAPAAPAQLGQLATVEGRLAMIEDRISRIDFQTDAAAGNAGRAEGLLIAFAARRMVDRGEPLGYVADQLRLRFMNAQPRAVQTVVDFAANPVTIDALSARLEALSPELTVTNTNRSLWDRTRQEFTALFVVRRDSAALANPIARIERARLMLTAKRIDSAIGEVERLPGADAAETWIADARRYEAVQKALDLLETTAMLEPNRLQDATGRTVDQPSPLAPAAPTGEPEPQPDATEGA